MSQSLRAPEIIRSSVTTLQPISTTQIITHCIDHWSNELNTISQFISQNPETKYEEYKAHERLTSFMESQSGWTVTRSAHGLATAWRAEFGPGGGRVVAFNSEYDALPEIGHGCGHNLIAVVGLAAGLGAAAAVQALNLKAKIVIVGTPAEESGGGKQKLVAAGAWNGVDACLMAHPYTNRCRSLFKPLASLKFRVEFFGKTAHASVQPWDAKNALDAMILLFNGLAVMRQQMIPTDRIHGVILNGGTAANVIPDYTMAELNVRSQETAQLMDLYARVNACVQGAAAMTGTNGVVTETALYEDMLNNTCMLERFNAYGAITPELERCGLGVIGDLPLDLDVELPIVNKGPAASSDQGNVSKVTASIHPMFAIPCDSNTAMHSREMAVFAAAPEAFASAMRAAKRLAMTGLDVVLDKQFGEDVVAEFDWRKRDAESSC